MPIYQLNESVAFPPVEHAEEGIVAVGGDLSPERLIAAYRSGIFPWFSEKEPIIWWAPDPRCILYPNKLKVSKSMKQLLRKKKYTITFDTVFDQVIQACSKQERPEQEGTWITNDMTKAYVALHQLGFAHSVEVWNETKLVGGLYGVAIGAAFFGESMFFHESNTSKLGFIHLVQFLQKNKFEFIDCQVETNHLISLGAELIPRKVFMQELNEAFQKENLNINWQYSTQISD